MEASAAIGSMIGAVGAIAAAARAWGSTRGVLPGREMLELLATMRVRHVARHVKCRNMQIVITRVICDEINYKLDQESLWDDI